MSEFDIEKILDMLDWNAPNEVQKLGVERAKKTGEIRRFIQPTSQKHNKNVWDNCAFVYNKCGRGRLNMRKCYVLNPDNLIFYCDPETTSELNEWYQKYFDISVGEYKRIVDCITRGKRKFLISFYSAYRKMNSLEKAMGMRKVFAQQGIPYEEKYREIAEEDGETSIFSIADFSEKNEEAFFCGVCSPQVVLCISDDKLRETSVLNSSNKKMDFIVNELLQNGDTVVRFSDYSCDGNSITVSSKNITDLFKEICSEVVENFERQ